MHTVSKGKFKARLLEYLRNVEKTGEDLVVTDHGVPKLRVTPYREREDVGVLFAAERGRVTYHADPDEPTQEEWENV